MKYKLFCLIFFVFFLFGQSPYAFSICEEGIPGTGASGSACTRCKNGQRRGNLTKEPVLLQNGNLVLTDQDVAIPVQGLPLDLTRTYNAQINSKVDGWGPEDGSGSWSLEGGEYSGDGGEAFSQQSYTDAAMDVDMKTVTPGDYGYETGSVYFHFQDSSNYYSFVIYTDGTLELGKYKQGWWYELVQKPSVYDPLEWNHVKIVTSGALIEIYINDTLEISYSDPQPLSSGRFALVSYNSHAHFDNVAIWDGVEALNNDFNSVDIENDTIFGQGWTFTYETRIFEDAENGLVTIRGADGAKEVYTRNADGSYTAPQGIYSKLTKTLTGGYTLREKNGTVHSFDLNGNLISIKDRNNNQITIYYTLIGDVSRPHTITDTSGRQVTLEYNENEKVKKIAYPAPEKPNFVREVSYIYEGNNLVEVDYPSGYKRQYTYDPFTGNLLTYTDLAGYTTSYIYSYSDKVIEEIDPDGRSTKFYYSPNNTSVANDRYEYTFYAFGEEDSLLTSVQDTLYESEYNTYDDNHNLIHFEDKLYRETDYEYDAQGNRTKIIRHRDGLPDVVSEFIYELTFNQVTSIKDPLGNTTQFIYDPDNGNLLKIINPEPFHYETTMTYDEFGNLKTLTDARGNITEYEYDVYGNRTKIRESKDVLNYTTIFTYDVLSQLTATINANKNPPTTYSYDKAGNLIKTVDSLGYVTEFTYDGNGNRLSETVYHNGAPITTLYEYDWANNLVKQTNADTTFMTYTYDLANFLHLGAANRLTAIDANDHTTIYEYDSENRLIKVTDPQDHSTEYTYDSVGNLYLITDDNENSLYYDYDDLNRLNYVYYPDTTLESYTYDDNGNLLTKTKQDRHTITFTYDALNRLKTKVYPPPDGFSVIYEYDPLDNLTSVTDPTGTIAYIYDEVNRLKEVTYPSGYTVGYAYDPVGNRTKLVYPDDRFLTYRYDSLNRLTMTKWQDTTRVAYYQYDDLSRRERLQLANKTSSDYSYDSLHRLTSVQNKTAAGNIISSFDYTYDLAGNRETMTSLEGTHNYVYDKINQLTDVAYPVGVPAAVNYQFDGVGNREMVTEDVEPISYSINSMNQYTQVGETTYTYDANGNLTSDGINVYTYDDENRLTSAVTPTMTVNYTYDPFGRRIKKEVVTAGQASEVTNYIYDADQVIMETDESGQPRYFYVYGQEIDEVLLRSSADAVPENFYYHYDGLGSVVSLTKKNGELVESYTYDVYGQPDQTSSVGNTRMFTGREYESETGLYYYRARYYSPVIGRFLQRDPLTWTPSDVRRSYQDDLVQDIAKDFFKSEGLFDTQLLHNYNYVSNNPLNRSDPLGLWYIDVNVGWISPWRVVGGTAGLLIGSQGISTYKGYAVGTKGPSASVTFSQQNPTTGKNVAGGFYAIDIFAGGQAGRDKYGKWFYEAGVGLPGGNIQVINVKDPWVWPWLRNKKDKTCDK